MSDAAFNKKLPRRRPRWYNLSLFNLPAPGIVSILHRISGLLLFLALPLLLYVFDGTVASPERYASTREFLGHPLSRLVALGLVWAISHHLCAGIRHLMMDVHIGIDLQSARKSSRVVLVLGALLTLLFGWLLLW